MKINKRIKLFFLRRRMLKSTFFDKDWYLKQYPEVQQEHIDPVRHYIERGWKEGKNPSEKFDTNKYLFSYPDIRRSNKNPLKHYLRCGKKEGRICFPVGQVGILKDKKTNDCPLVSVIVASYNYENFLPETIDSILKQTYTNYEIIIVDDGSVDKSIEIIEQYVSTHKNIYLYTHPNHENKGLPATIKLGVEKARGEFVAFIESGDKWHPQYLEKKVEIVNTYQDVKIISNNIELFGSKRAVEICKPHIDNINSFLLEGGNLIDVSFFENINYIPTLSTVLFQKSTLLRLDFNAPISDLIGFWLYRQILKDEYLFYTYDKLTFCRANTMVYMNKSDKLARDSDEFVIRSNELIGVKLSRKHQRDINVLNKSEYFDRAYYQEHYRDMLNGLDPVVHYLFVGWKKGCDPSASFDNDVYLINNLDVLNRGINPLIHYENYGRHKRAISSSTKKYRIQESDIEYVENFRGKSKTILLISHELSLTGAPRALLNMAIILKELGAIPVVLSLRGGDMEKELVDENIKYIVDPLLYLRIKFRDPEYCRFLSVFDSILFNTLETVSLVGPFPDVKADKICWLHEGSYSYEYWQNFLDLSSLYSLFDRIYAVGAYSESFATPYVQDKKQLGILLYGVPDIQNQYVKKVPDGKVKILLPGSIEERKAQTVLLESLKLLPKDILNSIKIYMAGSILNRKIGKMVKNCSYSCVEYLGLLAHEDLLELCNNVDVVLTPSLDDPMPIVCTEAMILNKPVIVSENTGTASFIENGVNGYKIPVNDPKALANAIISIVEHREELPALGKAARRIYDKNFTMEIFKDNVRKCILQC